MIETSLETSLTRVQHQLFAPGLVDLADRRGGERVARGV
jgi:hypothetical protein